jgi:hypothetical protein
MAEAGRSDGERPLRRAVAALAVVALVATVAIGFVVRRVVDRDDGVASATSEVSAGEAAPAETTTTPPATVEPTTTLLPPDFVPLTVPPPPPPPPPTTQPPPPPPPPKVVSVYGDSLVWEARFALGELLRPLGPNRVRSWGGTALCDYVHQIVDDARAQPTRLVVIGFTGNALTPCMHHHGPAPTSELVAAMYVADLNAVVDELHALGVPVLLVGAPPGVDADGASYWPAINDAWAAAAANWRSLGARVSYADAGSALAEGGQWTATLPCLPDEGSDAGCVDGRIPVRSVDKGHFCPALGAAPDGAIPECGVWSSGAWRYGQSIASAVTRHL